MFWLKLIKFKRLIIMDLRFESIITSLNRVNFCQSVTAFSRNCILMKRLSDIFRLNAPSILIPTLRGR